MTLERSEGKGQLPGEEEACGRAGSRKMELSSQRDEKTRLGRGGKRNISRGRIHKGSGEETVSQKRETLSSETRTNSKTEEAMVDR